jgi:hypothetical protein
MEPAGASSAQIAPGAEQQSASVASAKTMRTVHLFIGFPPPQINSVDSSMFAQTIF